MKENKKTYIDKVKEKIRSNKYKYRRLLRKIEDPETSINHSIELLRKVNNITIQQNTLEALLSGKFSKHQAQTYSISN